MRQIIFASILTLFFSLSITAQNEKSLCPVIKVDSRGAVQSGEPISFTANIKGGVKKSNLEYEWSISAGTIVSGQGASSISVDTTNLESVTEIIAEVKIKGLFENCPNTASETSSVYKIIDLFAFDEFGKLFNGDVKARMQNLFIELGNNPYSQGYIINYGTDKEIAVREKQIQKAINFFKYDANRVTIVRGRENPRSEVGVWTKIWIVPPGTEFPQP